MSEQTDNSGRYLYERLGDKRFQQLCAALLKHSDPDSSCYPVGQSDGGRDMVSGNAKSIIYQVKWTKREPKNPVSWLDDAIRSESDNIRALVKSGAQEYILMTSVAGTAPRGRGTMDQLDKRLQVHATAFGIKMRCEWRDDIDRRLESIPNEIKWTYQEMLAGVEAVRYLIEADNLATREHELRTLLLKVMKTQWHDDAKVKFRQVELESRDLIDLFVDVEAVRVSLPRRAESAQVYGQANTHLNEPVFLGGAAAYLLATSQPLTLVRGAPGQGKSTLGQYICQWHRAEFVPDDAYRSGSTPVTRLLNPRLPIRADLCDYATWLSGIDPFMDADDEPGGTKKRRSIGSVEDFLADLLRARSGGLPADVATVQDVLHRFPMLVVLDGLDEVANSSDRTRIVKEINEFSARLGASLNAPQVVVTTRPNASGMAEPSPDIFETIALTGLNQRLRTNYLRKWAAAHDIRGKDRRNLQHTFNQRSAEPHIHALADNPMQLTILLYLIKKRGSSVPSARTELYTSYMETLLDREAEKTPVVDEFRKDLEEITAYLGWYLQSLAETTADEGRLAIRALRRAILGYLDSVEKKITLVDALFTGVTDRVWALSSRVQGTFEFDVQPLREYFAARFLNEFAGADVTRFDKSIVLRHLVRRAYWLNTARFFTGFAKPNELAGLVEGLADECEELQRPRQARLAAWALVADGVFSARTRTKRAAADLFGDDLSIRLLAHALRYNPEMSVPAGDHGGDEIVNLLLSQLIDNPESPLSFERVTIIEKLQDRQKFVEWWFHQICNNAGGKDQSAWLRIAAPLHAASRLPAEDLAKLDLADNFSLPLALAAGVVPPPGSELENRMIQAVLAGQCSDVRGASPGIPADMLRVLAPQHLLRRASTDGRAYRYTVGHLDVAASEHQRQASWKRLNDHDDRFKQVQKSLEFDRGQSGTTSPWGNTARALADIYGPCWLASEIAVIGASLPSTRFATEGGFRKGAAPFGSDIDYGILLREVRFNRARPEWWAAHFASCNDPLSRATWAFALVAAASSQVLLNNLGNLETAVANLPEPLLSALILSSSRLGLSGLPRTLSRNSRHATTRSPLAVTLLISHYVPLGLAGRDRFPVLPRDEGELAGLSVYGASAWPALLDLTGRIVARPAIVSLPNIRRFGADATLPPIELGANALILSKVIIESPAEYPLEWVLAAEQQISNSSADAPLSMEAAEAGWFAL
ncbi:hypothetical protein ABTX61_24250 [Amycolatopsis japonica]|uniref:NACHT domain-containing protein n=1 Tax=Amycolatopsis japonica TaxID=208439 RepID=UPI003332DEC8